ncbi:hypothetical protein M918_18990 [Clostridium sp. BL8]|uniref:non-ribosomal peptide synthetase n=1 Tax=Clostridium sp. BL8 TaxID=1354301 RepID=UPI000389F440|nr:non-ribosomal peptide synthetase [Clostridium sp. BL8]EQB89765.1 hypothetical protein M918_18990 [Clostridium sp. BL8]
MEQVNKGLGHWNDQLKNLKSHEKFLWDYCDKSLYKKCIYKEVFDKEIGNTVSDICKNNNLLIYTFLVSTLKVTLSKYMGKNNIAIGIPCYSNQNMRGNVHINKLLPLVSYIDPEMTYLEYMGSIKAKVLENYKNQSYLSSKILVQNGLVNDVMELSPISICMKGLHEDIDINYICESSKNELSFLLDPMKDKSIGIKIVYNSNKITEDTVKALYQSYETALIDILNNYNKKIKDIKILSQKDMEKILHEFNDTKADYPKDKTIHELFQDQVEKTPDNIAVIFEDKKLTYRELNERSNSLARVLRDKGVKADSIVGIVVERSLEMIVGIMGILKAGGAYLPIDPNYPKGRIEYMLKDSGCRVLLSKNDLVETIEFNGEIIDLYDENLFNRGSSNLEKINNSTKLAYIIYTSGTTGKPKGAMIEHRSLVNRLNWMQKKYPITEKDTILQKTTYTFDVSVWEILWWSLVGAKVCMLTPNGEKDPMKIIETIDKYEVTTMHFVPSMLDVFLYCVEENRNNINLSSLRQVFSSGEALNFKQVSKFYKEFETGKKLINLYGPTEATIDVAYFDCASDGKRIIPIGKPIDNTELYILKNNELVPIGVAGELYIAGHGLARGYVNRPELTDEKFVDNPFEHGTKMYKTGDLARWLPDGNIEFLGRIDNQVKIRGFRIELGEIENRLLQHENIKEAAVLVKENKDSEKYICAYVVSDKKLQELDLKGYLKETLPEYMVPAYFVQVEKMPLKTNGKLERRALPEPNLDVTLTEYEAPRNKVEETLSKIWSEILGVEKVGINDNFFDLGGHSLKATMLMAKIHKELNKEVPLKELFKMPTIKELSQYIKNAEESPYSKIEKVEEKEYYEASSAQKRMYMLQQFDKNSTAYNMPVAFELKGEVDKWRVEEAFKKLVKRHEALRTYFQSNSSEIVQKVQKNYTFELMSKKEEGDIESIIDNFVRPFNLEKAPLFRVELIENENKTYLLIDMHHIISDGTSMGILIKDFENLYNQQDLDLLKLQYKDFAAWQNGLLKSQDMKKQEQYWINMFSDEIPVLNMPTDYKRPDVQSFEGDSVKFVIDKDTTIELKNLAKETGATIYMVLLSAVNILLSKYSGQEDVIVGSPIAGRKQENLQNIIGMFVNTLSMRNYPLGNKTYEEFLTEVKTNCLKAYENQEYQFEELVEKLNLKRYSNRNPVFDVMFILQNMKQYGVKLNNCSIEQYAYKNKTSKFDLLFIATEYEEKINFEIQYCSGLFKQDTVEKMIKRFKKVLSNITNNRHVQISEIDVLLDEERKKLLIEFNNTDVLYDNTITIKELFEERVEKTPNDVALVFKNKTMTYNDVNEYSNNLASYLFHHGNVGNNSKVGILMERSELMIIAILATLKVGGTYVPIDPQYPIDRIKIIAEDCEIRNMISSKEQIPILNKLQWECSKFQNYICLNCNNVYDVEEFNDSNFMSEDLWNHVVSSSSSKIGEGGWKSSYNGQEFSCEEMKEYSENTLYKLKPYINKDSKVLEIGCASGLTMFEIAPHVNEYFGTDMSGAVIERNSERVEKGCIKNIKLKCLKAHEINEIDDGDFDVIIINSVIQYFPGHNYLRSIIEKSLNLLKDKGIIYIGDIMDSELKEDLIESLNEFKRNNSSHGNKTKIQFDSELFVPRAYFEDIAIDFQEINKIEFSKKIHTIENELTKFRYDCVIEVSKSHSRKCIDKKYKYQHGLMDLMKYKNIPYISNIKSSDLAYILYTSGSTGKPKGVEVQHKAVVNFINGIVSSINFTNKNAILCATNISFDIFVLETLLPLILGLKIVIADEEEQINPQLLKKLIHDWNIDVLQVTPSRMQMIINEDKAVEELKKLKIILVGGEPLKETLLKSLSQTTNASIYNMYGPTETTVWSTFSKQSFTEQITIGKPINNTQIYILDKYMKLVPIGTSGEMYISGDGLAKGYVNNTELTAEKFIKNPFKLQGKMYKTGDFARWLPDGNIEFLGRIDNQVKIRGFRIELGEIENRLLQHEYIKGVVVLVKENKKNDKKDMCLRSRRKKS